MDYDLTESEIKDVMEARRLLHQSHSDFTTALELLEGDGNKGMAEHFFAGEGQKAAVNLQGAINLLAVSQRNLNQALAMLKGKGEYPYPYPKPTEGSKASDPQLSMAGHFFGPGKGARR